MVVIPPYGGIDEFDHAYRAASVARGHWQPSHDSSGQRRGDLLRVPPDIVMAAHSACARLPYTKHDNCNPASRADADGNVLVASSAASYNPIYYWFVGMVARPFSGVGALYAMRAATLVICDVLLFGALVVTIRRSRSLWPFAGLWLCSTPMVVYSTAIVAPNGVQAAAAVLLWTCFTAAATSEWLPDTKRLLVLGAFASCIEVTVHSTGPLWLALSVPPLCLIAGGGWLVEATSRHRHLIVTLSGLILAATLASVFWITSQGTNAVPHSAAHVIPLSLSTLMGAPFLWALQAIAAIPFRNQPAPMMVYAIGVPSFLAFLICGWLASPRRQRLATSFLAICFVGVPLILTIRTYDALGLAWQGRYALPLAFGLPLIAGWSLDRKRTDALRAQIVVLTLVVAYGLSQLVEIAHVRSMESRLEMPGAVAFPNSTELVMASLCSSALVAAGVVLLGRAKARTSFAGPRSLHTECVSVHD
jgi:hypothetical protein